MDGQDCFIALLERFEEAIGAQARLQVQVEDYARRVSKAEDDNKFLTRHNKDLAVLERFVDQPEINKLYKAFLMPKEDQPF